MIRSYKISQYFFTAEIFVKIFIDLFAHILKTHNKDLYTFFIILNSTYITLNLEAYFHCDIFKQIYFNLKTI